MPCTKDINVRDTTRLRTRMYKSVITIDQVFHNHDLSLVIKSCIV